MQHVDLVHVHAKEKQDTSAFGQSSESTQYELRQLSDGREFREINEHFFYIRTGVHTL